MRSRSSLEDATSARKRRRDPAALRDLTKALGRLRSLELHCREVGHPAEALAVENIAALLRGPLAELAALDDGGRSPRAGS